MEKNIEHTWFFNQPASVVWKYLTTPELIAQWLMENNFKPEVGHRFQFKTRPLPAFGFDGNVYCQVTELVPNKKLVYTWQGGPGNGAITLDSVVTWTLEETNNGTQLTLRHSGFKGFKNYIGYLFMNSGWKKIVQKRLPLLLAA